MHCSRWLCWSIHSYTQIQLVPQIREQQESDDIGDWSSLTCHSVQWKAVDGILEYWRYSPQFGAHILWASDVDKAHKDASGLLEMVFSITNAAMQM